MNQAKSVVISLAKYLDTSAYPAWERPIRQAMARARAAADTPYIAISHVDNARVALADAQMMLLWDSCDNADRLDAIAAELNALEGALARGLDTPANK